ncbi:MAG TPA: hypothetical protein VI759_07250, partial [Dehalococcoidia bacterium]|nr:hypothetical protein [Dehalococcoidia bacterium]
MDEDPTVPQEATTELQPDPEAPAIEGEPVDGEAQPVTRRRRGTRGGRGRGRSGGVAGAGPGGALIEKPRDTIRPVTPPAERRGVSPREPRGITPRAVPPARGRGRELPTGSVESLIARQNVLFEDFANRQSETMRDVQRALRGVSGRDSLPGAGHATLALPKVAIFLDVPNLIYAADDRNIKIDFGRL